MLQWQKLSAKSYLIPNDEVIVSGEFRNYACVWFQPKSRNETVGWIPLNNLKNVSIAQDPNGIVGKWKFYSNNIKINKTNKPDSYRVTGSASWIGLNNNVVNLLDFMLEFAINSRDFHIWIQ